MSEVMNNSFYATKRIQELLDSLEWLLKRAGKDVAFQIVTEEAWPWSVVILFRDKEGFYTHNQVGVRGKSYCQVISDIVNAICPATPLPSAILAQAAQKKKKKKPSSRGKGGAA